MIGDGIFGSMFDFDRGGTLDALERAVEFQFFDEIVMGNDSDEELEEDSEDEFNMVEHGGIRELTEIEQLLVDFLMTSTAKEGTGAIIFLLLQKAENKQLEMCHFLRDYPEATEDEILEMAQQIARIKH